MAAATETEKRNVGRIEEIQGVVIEAVFPDELPEIYSAITIDRGEGQVLVCEVQQHLGDDRVRAPMPGRVVALRVSAGDRVEAGQELVVLEAMKMELALKAPRAGTVAELRAADGEFVEADSVLVLLEPTQ